MQANKRNLKLDVCDYSNKVLCNIFDSYSDVSGQASNVFVSFERNGWKELSFDLPSKCLTDEGEEDNYRLDFLIADYRIRLQDDYGIDWYLISEPKITHNKLSKKVSVTAGHISQILKTKKMDLEFSDDEGNNVGTARELLTEILEGTGWTVGEVARFVENDDPSLEKVRTLNASTKTGAFKMIADMCDLFDAKPLYHGNERTVDILPLNPFSEELDDSGIPTKVTEDHIPVLELHYDKNTHNITRTINTENLVTKFYAYGSYGDREGMCSLQNAQHKEYNMTIPYSGTREYWFSDGVSTYYFTATANENDTVVWSDMDQLSMSYVWDNTSLVAYRVSKTPQTDDWDHELTPSIETVRNYFSFIMDFSYYDKVGLLSDDKLQYLANYQRTHPALLALAEEQYKDVIQLENELSVIAEHNTGFLKLNVQDIISDEGFAELVLNQDQPVYYRSDYDEPRKKLFTWYVADDLKEDGDPVNGIGSVVYAIDITQIPPRWRKAYVKKVNGVTEDYQYSVNQTDDPSNLTIWLNIDELSTLHNTHFYLFKTNSISGKLGVKESGAESLARTLQQTTKTITEVHPTYFGWDNDPEPETSLLENTYGWFYRAYRDTTNLGTLKFCYGLAGDTAWRNVYVSETAPTCELNAYWFNSRTKVLYHGEYKDGQSTWVNIADSGIVVPSHNAYFAPDAESQRLSANFAKVVFYCLKRDMLYKGVYEKYEYTANEEKKPNNYALKDEYGFLWCFTTEKTLPAGKKLTLDTLYNHVFLEEDEDFVKAEIKTFDTIDYPVENELTGLVFSEGAIDKNTYQEINSSDYVRSNNITLNYSTLYDFNLQSGSYIMLYDSNKRYITRIDANGSNQSFTTSERTRYGRIVSPTEPSSARYLRVHDYLHKLFISKVQYTILGAVGASAPYVLTPVGDQVGINELIKGLVEYSDELYYSDERREGKLPIYLRTAEEIKTEDNALATELGDMYREGWWQQDNYTEGDEAKLYQDAKDNLEKVAKPETTYNFTFLDLFGSDQALSADDSAMPTYPDIDISYAAHLVDQDIDINVWAFIDKLQKCYDLPWQTKIEINTNLSLINQHSFTDVISHIADVANQTSANQSIYKRASAISGSGTMAATRLEGAIQANVNLLNGGSSNWYTDAKGNIVLESSDGNSAMMLSGAGWFISTEKDKEGDWQWRETATGNGITADAIYTGYLSGSLIEADTITVNKLSSNVGQELEIGSNKALQLFATTDGFKPAGSLHTRQLLETDSLIDIRAGYQNAQGQTVPASISIESGGLINIKGGSKINIESSGQLNVAANGSLNLNGGTVNINSNSTFDINAGSKMHINAGEFTVSSPNFSITKNNNTYDVALTGTIHSEAGDIAGFTMGKDNSRKYLYAGSCNSMSSTADGVYIGTDGINIKGKLKFSSNGNTAELYTNASNIHLGDMGSYTTLSGKINAMDTATGNAATAASNAATAASNAATAAAEAKKIAKGAAFDLDAQAGTISIKASTSISVVSGGSINIAANNSLTLTTNGTLLIGKSGKLFTIGGVANKAYIYCDKTSLDSDTTEGIYLGTDGIALGANTNLFKVTRAGALTAKNADITGKITANLGEIAGWTISSTGIYNSTTGVSLTSGGQITGGSYFTLTGSGMTATGGSIAGWKINEDELTSNDSTIALRPVANSDSSEIISVKKRKSDSISRFSVERDGTVYLTKLYLVKVVSGDLAVADPVPLKDLMDIYNEFDLLKYVEVRANEIIVRTRSGKLKIDSSVASFEYI